MDSRSKRSFRGDSSRENDESSGGSSRRFDALRNRATSQEQEREAVRAWDKADEDSGRIKEIARKYLPQSDYKGYKANVRQHINAFVQPEPGYNHRQATDEFMAMNQEMKTKIVYEITQVLATDQWDMDPAYPGMRSNTIRDTLTERLSQATKAVGEASVAGAWIDMLTNEKIPLDIRKALCCDDNPPPKALGLSKDLVYDLKAAFYYEHGWNKELPDKFKRMLKDEQFPTQARPVLEFWLAKWGKLE